MAVDLSYLSATPLPSEETKRKTEEIKEGEKNKAWVLSISPLYFMLFDSVNQSILISLYLQPFSPSGRP